MAGNEGSSIGVATRSVTSPTNWGKVRRLAAALLVAFSMVSALSVVFAGTTSAQVESDPVLRWLPEIQAASAATGVPSEVIAAVIRVESGGDPNAVSVAGAIGLMQVMPAEFQSQGIPESAWFDPATNIMAGSTEIGKFLVATGSIEQALASYFGSGCDAVGTCTDGYIATVMSYAAAYAVAIANGTPVDLSGIVASTGGGFSPQGDKGGDGFQGDGSWYGGPPATDSGGWQWEAPGHGDWQSGPDGGQSWEEPIEGGETGVGEPDPGTDVGEPQPGENPIDGEGAVG